jgi:hypothetical protein
MVAGLLADIPFVLEWYVSSRKVITYRRMLAPADLRRALLW